MSKYCSSQEKQNETHLYPDGLNSEVDLFLEESAVAEYMVQAKMVRVKQQAQSSWPMFWSYHHLLRNYLHCCLGPGS